METPLHYFTVVPKLPPKLKPLEEMAYNLLFSWDAEIRGLFRRLDPHLWELSGHNPVWMLSRLKRERIRELEKDEAFISYMERTYERFRQYLQRPAFTPYADLKGRLRIGYFSAEYGLTDCLPFYHGGLGVLAGDMLKSASDLDIPMVGVGLLYQFGAFRQELTFEGEQKERIPELDFYHMPLRLQRNEGGEPLLIKGRKVLRPFGAGRFDIPHQAEFRFESAHQ